MTTELYQNTVSQCAINEKCFKYHYLIYQGHTKRFSRIVKEYDHKISHSSTADNTMAFQELELLLNSIYRALHKCILSLD